jgi:hypothetical protein
MKLKNVIGETYPLIEKYLHGYSPQVHSPREKSTAVQLQTMFMMGLDESPLLSMQSKDPNYYKTYVGHIKTLTDKALSIPQPDIALVGFAYVQDLRDYYRTGYLEKKLKQHFAKSETKFDRYFNSLDNEDMKQLFLETKEIALQSFNAPIDAQTYSKLAEQVMGSSRKPS